MDRRWQVTQDGDGAMTVHAARLLEMLAGSCLAGALLGAALTLCLALL